MTKTLRVLFFLMILPGATTAFDSHAHAASIIDINDYIETFSDNFKDGVDVTAWGPSRWIAHTPWHGDFGDARFVDPRPNFPFSTDQDGLKITARKTPAGKWESGLLSSRDDKARGFMQAGGYFEARMKMPSGPGVWPAFWLISEGNEKEKIEIDIVEYYGRRTDRFHSVVHVWPKQGSGDHTASSQITNVSEDSLVQDFHIYGAEILDTEIVFYLDRKEVWRTSAPASARQPVMLLINLALGSGWPIDGTYNPSSLSIDYIKAYQRKPK
jgi:beta-glucanase (GH16 family)